MMQQRSLRQGILSPFKSSNSLVHPNHDVGRLPLNRRVQKPHNPRCHWNESVVKIYHTDESLQSFHSNWPRKSHDGFHPNWKGRQTLGIHSMTQKVNRRDPKNTLRGFDDKPMTLQPIKQHPQMDSMLLHMVIKSKTIKTRNKMCILQISIA